MNEADCIELEKLSTVGVLPDGGHIHILQKCIVCLENQGHSSPVNLAQHDLRQGMVDRRGLEVRWSTPSTDQWRKAYADYVETAEDSAKGIAFLVMRRLGFDLCEQAPRGSRVDYFMSKSVPDQDDTFIFNEPNLFGLEVSGILNGPANIQKRVNEKKGRINGEGGFKPSIIVVVEHSAPQVSIDMVC